MDIKRTFRIHQHDSRQIRLLSQMPRDTAAVGLRKGAFVAGRIGGGAYLWQAVIRRRLEVSIAQIRKDSASRRREEGGIDSK